MSIIKYCGVALCALAAVLFLRGQRSEFAGYISLGASVVLLGAAITVFLPIYEYIQGIVSGTSFGGYLAVLAKALGITLAVQLTAELCRDSGEAALASKLELLGKAEVLLLCLPLLGELVNLAAELMGI